MRKILGILALIISLVTIMISLIISQPKIIENLKLKTTSSHNSQSTTANLKLSVSPTSSIKNHEREFKTKLYNLINAYRRENSLSPLVVHPNLELSANYKLQDMISKNYWRHQDNQSRSPWQFFAQAGYNYVKAGENLGFNQSTAYNVFQAWTRSPTHNQQLLNSNYEHMGLAVDCQTLKKLDPQSGCVVVLHLGKM